MKCISKEGNIEQEIIDNLRSSVINRRKAEEQLYCRYSYLMKAGIKKYAIGADDAFNAYSDTVLAVIDSLTYGTFEGKCSLRTYMHGIFHHKSVDVVRKKASQKKRMHQAESIHGEALYLSDGSKSIIEKLVIQTDIKRLKEKIDQLRHTSRQIILLSAGGYKDKEIAELLKYKTANVVKTTRLRCIRKLFLLLKNEINV